MLCCPCYIFFFIILSLPVFEGESTELEENESAAGTKHSNQSGQVSGVSLNKMQVKQIKMTLKLTNEVRIKIY